MFIDYLYSFKWGLFLVEIVIKVLNKEGGKYNDRK